MSEYNPDVWVMLKFTHGEQTTYKVLAGWYGGYLNGDSWKLNSGVTAVEVDADGYLCFSGYSGSVYRCHPNCYRMSGMTSSIYESFVKKVETGEGVNMELMPETTDFANIKYED